MSLLRDRSDPSRPRLSVGEEACFSCCSASGREACDGERGKRSFASELPTSKPTPVELTFGRKKTSDIFQFASEDFASSQSAHRRSAPSLLWKYGSSLTFQSLDSTKRSASRDCHRSPCRPGSVYRRIPSGKIVFRCRSASSVVEALGKSSAGPRPAFAEVRFDEQQPTVFRVDDLCVKSDNRSMC